MDAVHVVVRGAAGLRAGEEFAAGVGALPVVAVPVAGQQGVRDGLCELVGEGSDHALHLWMAIWGHAASGRTLGGRRGGEGRGEHAPQSEGVANRGHDE